MTPILKLNKMQGDPWKSVEILLIWPVFQWVWVEGRWEQLSLWFLGRAWELSPALTSSFPENEHGVFTRIKKWHSFCVPADAEWMAVRCLLIFSRYFFKTHSFTTTPLFCGFSHFNNVKQCFPNFVFILHLHLLSCLLFSYIVCFQSTFV